MKESAVEGGKDEKTCHILPNITLAERKSCQGGWEWCFVYRNQIVTFFFKYVSLPSPFSLILFCLFSSRFCVDQALRLLLPSIQLRAQPCIYKSDKLRIDLYL